MIIKNILAIIVCSFIFANIAESAPPPAPACGGASFGTWTSLGTTARVCVLQNGSYNCIASFSGSTSTGYCQPNSICVSFGGPANYGCKSCGVGTNGSGTCPTNQFCAPTANGSTTYRCYSCNGTTFANDCPAGKVCTAQPKANANLPTQYRCQ
jgi:hypothetical protein